MPEINRYTSIVGNGIIQDVFGHTEVFSNTSGVSVNAKNGDIDFKDKWLSEFIFLSEDGVSGLNSVIGKQSIIGNLNELLILATPFSGTVSGASFIGDPRRYSVVFPNNYADEQYSISVIGEDARIWSLEDKTVSGFTINSNAKAALAGEVNWQTQRIF